MKEVHSVSPSPDGDSSSGLLCSQLSFLGKGPYNLHLAPGECVGITGLSGVGKTQLLRAIADVIPHQGECFLNAKMCQTFSPPTWRGQVAMLPAESFWWHDSVAPHFQAQKMDSSFTALLERLGFSDEVLSWDIRRLSTGERQRLALLRILINKPQVLLLDEPTSALDQAMLGAVEEIIQEYCALHQVACLWVSHDLEQLFRVASRVFRLEKSGLNEEDAPCM